jgi:phytoene dehydrogenase-like protein
MGAVTQALAAAARDLGVEIRTSTPVGEVLVEGGAATGVVLESGETIRARAVLSNADPKRTFFKLTPAGALPAEFRRRIEQHYRIGGSVFKLNLALHELPHYTAAPADAPPELVSRATVDITPTLAYLERAWDDFKADQPSREPFIEIFSRRPPT